MKTTIVALFCFALMCVVGRAQTPEVSVELAAEEVVIGQPLILRIKVLVPTFMPDPPEFPALEIPGLMVRLPERASGPVSEQIDGETWSGVQRSYRLYPLRDGVMEIPVQPVRVTYAPPEGGDPKVAILDSDPIRFSVTVPDGAQGLDPLIVAQDFSLTQDVSDAAGLTVGGAVTRTVTATISGTPAVMIPELTPQQTDPALRPYPDEPRVSETEDRGKLAGTRVERTSYVAQTEGAASLPAMRVEWFDLETNTVKSAEVPEVELNIAGAAALPMTPETRRELTLRWLAIALGVALLTWGLWAWGRPLVLRFWARVIARWRASEHHAWANARRAIAKRNLTEAAAALDHWRGFWPELDARAPMQIEEAFANIGAARFGHGGDASAAWNALLTKAVAQRRAARRARHSTRRASLPPLNPS